MLNNNIQAYICTLLINQTIKGSKQDCTLCKVIIILLQKFYRVNHSWRNLFLAEFTQSYFVGNIHNTPTPQSGGISCVGNKLYYSDVYKSIVK